MNPSNTYLRQGEANYPAELTDYLGEQVPAMVALWGERDIWFKRNDNEPLLALFCSTKAPASILLQVHDLAQQWRTGGVTVISGYHSPVEQECLAVLLRGPQPVIVCFGLTAPAARQLSSQPLGAVPRSQGNDNNEELCTRLFGTRSRAAV